MTSPFIAPTEESDWLSRIHAGDESAFESLFRAYAPGLCVFVGRLVGTREAAEEIVQDLFLAIWRRRETLKVESSLSAYLHAAAKNKAYDWLKREGNSRWQTTEPSASLLVADPAALGENELLAALELQDAIANLPPRCRLVFTLSRQQNMSYAEIAASLGISTKTVEVQIGRALKSIRTRLDQSA